MGCCHYFVATEGGADAFTVEMPRVTFGRGVLNEVGERARSRGIGRAALFTDAYLADSEHLARARKALSDAGVDFGVYSEVRIEPTDSSVLAAADFLKKGNFDGVVSVGGGSVIDTAKGAMACPPCLMASAGLDLHVTMPGHWQSPSRANAVPLAIRRETLHSRISKRFSSTR